jgi:site-specific DNA-methyltransferase (adenine-specific)
MKQETENLTLESPEPVANVETRAVGSSAWLGSVSVTNEDCMALMRRYPDKHFDLAIVDPPYCIGRDGATESKTCRPGRSYARKAHEYKGWDAKPPGADYFCELYRVSKDQIIWGANYYPGHLPKSMGWIFWDKGQRICNSDGELAFTSFDRALRVVTMNRVELTLEGTIHPTQKPVKLYRWLLENYAKPGQRILDTHLGSGSHAIACHYFGAHLTACELDPDYFAAAQERIARETAQTTLF